MNAPSPARLLRPPRSEGQSASKGKRIRLKVETRAQLFERLHDPQITLYEASVLLGVSRAKVRRYADLNLLPCTRTPGGQRRFSFRAVLRFVQNQSRIQKLP